MDLAALGRSPVGRLEPISGEDARWGHFESFAFVPHPLPSAVDLTEGTFAEVADAAMALGRLDMAATRVPNPGLLVRPSLRKEAQSTSALEGTYAPLTEVLAGEIVGRDAASAETREVLNYVAAAELGVALIQERPIGRSLLGRLQGTLVSGTRGDSFDAGDLRRRLVMIGAPTRPIDEARFVPPPPGEILERGVADWETWIHAEGHVHLIVRATLGHYQFETLHPYSDGNGRLGRLVIALQLMEAGALHYPLLNIAEWLEPRKADYQQMLLDTSVTGDFDAWVRFLSIGIRERSDAAVARIDGLLSIRDSILERVRQAGSRGGVSYRIADELVGFPVIDVPWVAARHGVSYQAADKATKRLVGLGVLQQSTRKTRTRKTFFSPEVLRYLE
jgi:cell filamentation protein, protein adenylyltransferase